MSTSGCRCEVIGDAARLRQVLLNLAGNAIKFTATGGVALIVEPGIWPNEISFLVRDTGIGIAPEAQRADFPRVRAGRRAHRPQLWRHRPGARASASASSSAWAAASRWRAQPGDGSTFEVSIPLAACRQTASQKAFRGAGSDRPIDHAGGAADHRSLADRAAAAALGRPDLHGVGCRRSRRRCCRSGRGTPC